MPRKRGHRGRARETLPDPARRRRHRRRGDAQMTKPRRVSIGMKTLLLLAVLVACGHKQPASVSNEGSGAGSAVTAPPDNRTAIEKRRDGACDTLGPKITSCAVEDAKKELAAGKI